jgi:hypothetical protein
LRISRLIIRYLKWNQNIKLFTSSRHFSRHKSPKPEPKWVFTYTHSYITFTFIFIFVFVPVISVLFTYLQKATIWVGCFLVVTDTPSQLNTFSSITFISIVTYLPLLSIKGFVVESTPCFDLRVEVLVSAKI